MEGDVFRLADLNMEIISIHSLRMEGDFLSSPPSAGTTQFQSTPSAWRETAMRRTIRQMRGISIHSLRMEGDKSASRSPVCLFISIHSLRMEGDRYSSKGRATALPFQSTPSAWRETEITYHHFLQFQFQSTPSAWRETSHLYPSVWIATDFNPLPPHGGRLNFRLPSSAIVPFQSTPSAWRETWSC